MKRRQSRITAIPPHYATGAGERAAASGAGVRYIADLDGKAPNMHWVIKVRETGEIVEHCPTVGKPEVEERVALLNRGKPTRQDNIAWGIMTKPGRTIKSDDPAQPSATEWVHRLVNDPTGETSACLRGYAAEDRALTFDALRGLLHKVGHQSDFDENLLEAISKQLERKFGIRRAEDGRRGRT